MTDPTPDTTTTPDPDVAVAGAVDEEVEFDETDDLVDDEPTLEPPADSPVHDEATADQFSDPGL